jgi:UDP-N-acetylglucosamine 1-carboxyvinyltransferase
MGEQFVVEGGHTLNGTVEVGGNKNAITKLMAACLLTDQPVTLTNAPSIGDVRVMSEILRSLGAEVQWLGPKQLQVWAKNLTSHRVDARLGGKMRASINLAGPLLGRLGKVEIGIPGGDVIGRRRLDTHVLAFEKLGAMVSFDGAFGIEADGLRGANILLDEASVTATENAITAAVLAEGTTILRNAACEPHVQDLCNLLNLMGAQISGIGSNQITIEGVRKLNGCTFRVGADFLEVGSFIGAAAVTGGEVRIKNADPQHLSMISLVFRKIGVNIQTEGEDVLVPRDQPMRIVADLGGKIPVVKAQPWPAFPSDLMSICLLVATQSAGAVMFHEWMYDGRLFFTDTLVRMGARIVLCDPHRALVQGPATLRGGGAISSPDIRAGVTMLLAALCAKGTTTIGNIEHIDRAYEQIEAKLTGLGANIVRKAV